FALGFAELAVTPDLDAIGQILGDLALEAAQHERTQFRTQTPARDALGVEAFLAGGLRLVGLGEMFLRAEIPWLDEVGDAPEIHEAVLERGSGESQALVGLELFDRL